MNVRFAVAFLCFVTFNTAARGDEPAVNQWRPLPGETFEVADKPAFVIRPARPASGNPWMIYAPTFNEKLPAEKDEGWMFERFLQAGIAIAGVDVGESYGNIEGRAAFTALYNKLTATRGLARTKGLSRKVALLGRSRGGLMIYNWAAENPDRVACIAGIYPVLDMSTWPGVAQAAPAYKMTAEELHAQLKTNNPVDRLAPLAKAKVPIFQIHGDADTTVPFEQNAAEPARRYQAAGGNFQLLVAKGQGHSHWEGFFQCQELVDFVIRHAKPKVAGEK